MDKAQTNEPGTDYHIVSPADAKRIACENCDSAPAVICEHAHWNTGNTTGVSFWYRCLRCARNRPVATLALSVASGEGPFTDEEIESIARAA